MLTLIVLVFRGEAGHPPDRPSFTNNVLGCDPVQLHPKNIVGNYALMEYICKGGWDSEADVLGQRQTLLLYVRGWLLGGRNSSKGVVRWVREVPPNP